MRKRILILGTHPVLPRLVSHYVEQRAEVVFQRPAEGFIDLCLVCQRADMKEVGELVEQIPNDMPAILVTDAAVYNGKGEAPASSKRGMSELQPVVYEGRDDQLAQMWLESHFRRSTQPRIIVRLFDVYGPGVLSGVIPEWTAQAMMNEPIQLDAFDLQRTFLYIDDFITVFRALESRLNDVKFDVFNVGATELISASRLAHYVWTMTHGQNSTPKVEEYQWDDYPTAPSQVWKLPNIRRVRGFAEWSPTVSLRQGLFHTIDYTSKRLKNVLAQAPSATS